jgi:hypothetical protein
VRGEGVGGMVVVGEETWGLAGDTVVIRGERDLASGWGLGWVLGWGLGWGWGLG